MATRSQQAKAAPATKTAKSRVPVVQSTAEGKAVRRTLLDNGESGTLNNPEAQATMAKLLEEDTVLVNVPNAYDLTLNDHRQIRINPGVQLMPESMAEHWFSKANGVKRHTLTKAGE